MKAFIELVVNRVLNDAASSGDTAGVARNCGDCEMECLDDQCLKGRSVGDVNSAAAIEYYEKNFSYSKEIFEAREIGELTLILYQILREAQAETMRFREEICAARLQVQIAEARSRALETRLEEMIKVSREDQLTGSLNRRGLENVIERELARSARRSSPLCVAMLDLDDFKNINDIHGHVAGDLVLIHLVRVIKETLRVIDVICRFGGEEFLIVFPDTDINDAMQIVMRLQCELARRTLFFNSKPIPITFSVGVASYNQNEGQLQLLKRADEAMYKAKQAGKNLAIAAD
jgi:diguanylate cyclase